MLSPEDELFPHAGRPQELNISQQEVEELLVTSILDK